MIRPALVAAALLLAAPAAAGAAVPRLPLTLPGDAAAARAGAADPSTWIVGARTGADAARIARAHDGASTASPTRPPGRSRSSPAPGGSWSRSESEHAGSRSRQSAQPSSSRRGPVAQVPLVDQLGKSEGSRGASGNDRAALVTVKTINLYELSERDLGETARPGERTKGSTLAYARGTLGGLVTATTRGALDRSFMRTLARSALNWDFQRRTERSVRRVSLQDLLDESIEVTLALAPHVWGQTPVIDLVALNALVRLHRPRSIFEFGTFTGHGTVNLYLNAPAAKTYTLDLPPQTRASIDGLHWEQQIDDRAIGSAIRGAACRQITQLHLDSRELDTTPYAGDIDFVFIDGGHELEFVESDSRKAFEMVSPHGVIAWHDFSRACPGVESYIARLATDHNLYAIDGTQVVFCYGPAGPPTSAPVAMRTQGRQASRQP